MSSFHQQFTWKVLTVYLFLCVNVSLCLEIDCNRTYTGTIGTKYPLYLKEPIQKFAAFNCQVTFSALGSTHGDIIELSILSFQVGYFPVTKEFPVCEYGYVRIHEKQIKKPANVSSSLSPPLSEALSSQPSSFSSFSSSSSSPSFSSQAIPSLAENSNVGKFCGQLMSRRATFYSQGNNLTLTISLQEGRAFFSQYLPLNIYLTYRFLPVNFFTSTTINPTSAIITRENNKSRSSNPSGSPPTESRIKLPGIISSPCNQIFDDCLDSNNNNNNNNKCRLLSPNYPGFYPRNVTCHYLIKQKLNQTRNVNGLKPRITINQSNEYRISIFSGSTSTSTGKQTRTGLISDCPLDKIIVYDGPTTKSPRLLQFCGTGNLPPITSSKGEMLLVLVSVSDNALSDSRFEIDISIKLTKEESTSFGLSSSSPYHLSSTSFSSSSSPLEPFSLPQSSIVIGENGQPRLPLNINQRYQESSSKCEYIYNGSSGSRSGQFEGSLQPSTSQNTSCTYQFMSINSFDKIWLQFISYFTEDSHPWSSEEKCDSGELQITEIVTNGQQYSSSLRKKSPNGNVTIRLIGHFCEKSSPKICGRASVHNINNNHRSTNHFKLPVNPRPIDSVINPMVPCSYPKESYISKGSNLMISQFQRRLPGLTYIPTKFTARYEFIDTYESGDPIIGTLCDRRFDSIKSSTGTIRSSRNLFFYGRGGNRDVSCSYYFNGRIGEKLILKITSLKLTSASQLCQQSTNDPIQTYSCISPLNPSSSSSQSISTSSLSTLTKTKSTFGLRGKDNQLKQSSYSSKGFPLSKTRASASLSSVSSSSSSPSSSSTLRIYDSVTNELLSVACFCDSTNLTVNLKKPIILNLIGSQSVLNFTIIGMNFNQDYNDFNFEGKYEFIDNNYCSSHSIDSTQTDLESEGSISYQVPSDLDWSTNSQFKCRWIFIWYPNKFVSLRFDGYRPKRGQQCEGKNRIVIYWDSPWRPMATVCARNSSIVQRVGGNGNDQVETINLSLSLMQSSSLFGTSFPSSQSNSSTSMKRRPSSSSSPSTSSSSLATSLNHNDNNHLSSLSLPQDANRFQWKSQDNLYPPSAISFFNSSSLRVIIEIIAETPSAHFNFHWLTHKSPPPAHQKTETSETLRNTDCLYKCPELNFCLSPDLLCDGVKHCPSGYDESNIFCSSSSLIATLFFTLIIMILAVGGIFYSIIRSLRRRSSQSTSIHDIGSCLPATTIFGSLEETGSGSIGRESSSVSSGSFSNFTHLTSSSTNRPPSLTSKYMLPNHQSQLQNPHHHHGATLSTIGEFEFHSSLGGPLIPSTKLNTQSTDFSSLLSSSSPSSSEHSSAQRPLTLSITNLKNDSYSVNVNTHTFDNPNNNHNYNTSYYLRKNNNNKHTLSHRHHHQHGHYHQSINTIQSPTNSTFSPHHNSQTTSFTSSSSTSTS